eukprot:TRINITY_DN603_c0_g1_i1.p2 TRINITY_DN603_c0_g1~~TRINITY_DN603_c0_g1_i1.p2  ORF type:complete len:177 (+),score=57.09 TRINITY_DN603_c0_g1_i1:987-1517(+)
MGYNILHVSSKKAQNKVIEYLFKNKIISPTEREEVDLINGKTPLMLATENGKANTVKLLIKNRCNVTSTDKNGKSLLYQIPGIRHNSPLPPSLPFRPSHQEGVSFGPLKSLSKHIEMEQMFSHHNIYSHSLKDPQENFDNNINNDNNNNNGFRFNNNEYISIDEMFSPNQGPFCHY